MKFLYLTILIPFFLGCANHEVRTEPEVYETYPVGPPTVRPYYYEGGGGYFYHNQPFIYAPPPPAPPPRPIMPPPSMNHDSGPRPPAPHPPRHENYRRPYKEGRPTYGQGQAPQTPPAPPAQAPCSGGPRPCR